MIHPETSSHRLHRLTLSIKHQTAQIPDSGLTLIHPPQPREHPRSELLQLLPNPRQPSLIHAWQPTTIPKRLQATHHNELTKSY